MKTTVIDLMASDAFIIQSQTHILVGFTVSLFMLHSASVSQQCMVTYKFGFQQVQNSEFTVSSNLCMGTKIDYSINLLATLVDSSNLAVGGVDVWEHYQNKHQRTGIKKLQGPMDRMLDRNNVESIKKTMQMHEDIFKHQVRELHRVYNVQKMLMDELKNETRQQKFWNHRNEIDLSHPHIIKQQHQITHISHKPDFHVQNLREDIWSREKGRILSDTIQMQRGFDLERPAEEDIFSQARGFDEGEPGPSSHAAFQSCKISTGGYDEEMEVDLTLSIGGSQVNKSSQLPQLACSNSNNGKTRKLNSSASFKSDRTGECSDPTTPMSSSTVTFTREGKGPHWLSQGLKLK
ncbi:unnamed protein product [Sphenostylis stenocarpa]|uniref:Uncharacterized protein n=1 Tax=Sphenostylis stenocarpa TaxID=92480 RepID=A0AA86VGG0_9FABA|nr:unnamed protein product [Sphenostylis stenocarpa]